MGPQQVAQTALVYPAGAAMHHPTLFSLVMFGSRGASRCLILWPMGTTVEVPSGPTLLRFAMVSRRPKGQAAARWILGVFFVDRVEGAVRRCTGDPGPGYGARGPGTGTGKNLRS